MMLGFADWMCAGVVVYFFTFIVISNSSSPAAACPSGPPGSGSRPAADPSDSSSNERTPADIGKGLADKRAVHFDPATQMGMGLDPGAIQAVSAASGVWDEDGCLEHFFTSKLTVPGARCSVTRCNDNMKLELQHLAVATPAGTSLVAIQRHAVVTLATWDAMWEEYLHPKWVEQKLRLYGAQEKALDWRSKQLVVFFSSAGIGMRGGVGGKAVLQACRKVVERQGDSGRPTNRLDQATHGDVGKWVDRDCNAAFNLQRIGEAKWRPLELCWWKCSVQEERALNLLGRSQENMVTMDPSSPSSES
ncbi:hypothetical protein QJQ45_005174 [Haematococcus lacustris]|nr:hypothetical protein QJQ45_005174 [Haematococcus lacustris]